MSGTMTGNRPKLKELVHLAKQYLAAGDTEGTVKLCLHILDYYPDMLEILRLLARTYTQQNRLEEADRLFQAALQIETRDALSYAARGFIATRQETFGLAIFYYERAIEIDPRLEHLQPELDKLYQAIDRTRPLTSPVSSASRQLLEGNFDRAITEFETALEKAPDRLDIREGLLEAYWRNFNYQKAVRLGAQLSSRQPQLLRTNLILWHIYHQKIEHKEEAVQHLRQATKFDPRNKFARQLFSSLSVIDKSTQYLLKNDLAHIPTFSGELKPLPGPALPETVVEPEAVTVVAPVEPEFVAVEIVADSPPRPAEVEIFIKIPFDSARLLAGSAEPKSLPLPVKVVGLLPAPLPVVVVPLVPRPVLITPEPFPDFQTISLALYQNIALINALQALTEAVKTIEPETALEPVLPEVAPPAAALMDELLDPAYLPNTLDEQPSMDKHTLPSSATEPEPDGLEPAVQAKSALIEVEAGQEEAPVELEPAEVAESLPANEAEVAVASEPTEVAESLPANEAQASEPVAPLKLEAAEVAQPNWALVPATAKRSYLKREATRSAPMLNRHAFHRRDERGEIPPRIAALLAQEAARYEKQAEQQNKLAIATPNTPQVRPATAADPVIVDGAAVPAYAPYQTRSRNRLVVPMLAVLVLLVLSLNGFLFLSQQNLGQELAASRRELGQYIQGQNGAVSTALAELKNSSGGNLSKQIAQLDEVQKRLESEQQNIGKLVLALGENKNNPQTVATGPGKEQLQTIYQNLSLLNDTALSVLQAHTGYPITSGGLIFGSTDPAATPPAITDSGPGVVGAINGADAQKLAALAYAPRGWPVQGAISSPFGPRPKIFGPNSQSGQGGAGPNFAFVAAETTDGAPSATPSPTAQPSPTTAATATPDRAATATAVCRQLQQGTPTVTSEPMPGCSPTPTNTATATFTPTPNYAATQTARPTDTPTPLPTDTPVPTPTFTATPYPTHTPTNTPKPTNTATATFSPTPSPTNTATSTPSPSATATSTPPGPTNPVGFPTTTSQIAPSGTQIIAVATLTPGAAAAIPTYFPARVPLVNPGVPLNQLGVSSSNLAVGPGQEFHTGIDIAVPEGVEVRATARGVVEYAGNQRSGYGWVVFINHPGGFVTVYAHNSRLLVVPGQEVQPGQVIALSGNTGYSTGPHVHYEVRYQNRVADPLPFMQ